jgi:hypothetical protein
MVLSYHVVGRLSQVFRFGKRDGDFFTASPALDVGCGEEVVPDRQLVEKVAINSPVATAHLTFDGD